MANSKEELERIIKESLKRSFGLDDGAAAALAEEVVKSMAELVGGSYLYVPATGKGERIQRNEQIRQEFNGANAMELGRKYGLSRRQIQRITTSEAELARRRFRKKIDELKKRNNLTTFMELINFLDAEPPPDDKQGE